MKNKNLVSRGIKFFRENIKKGCSILTGKVLGSKSYPYFGVPSGLTNDAGKIKQLCEEPVPEWREPFTLDASIYWKFRAEQPSSSDGILIIENGIGTSLGGNLNSKGKLASTYLNTPDGKLPHQHDLFRFSTKKFFPKMYKVEKPVIALTAGWQGAFYHWMYDVLPRLHLVERAGINADHIYVEAKTDFQKKSLELLELNSVINAGDYHAVQSPNLIVPSTPSRPTKWGCQFLRDSFLPKLKKLPPCKLYVSRNDASRRRILNEEAVMEILEPLGFKRVVMSELTFKEQMEIFHSAEAVIGPHGAAFSHLAFCNPGTPILEFFNPEYVNVCYWQISNLVNLPYYYLFGEGERFPDHYNSQNDPDISVNLDQLQSILTSVLG